MLGRIYAGENCRNILYDKKELELKSKTKILSKTKTIAALC